MALATGQITINNIKETISVVFSKDNHVFPGGVSSALASSVDISVKAYIGTQEVAYTFGTVTPAAPTGLTITPSSANKKITLTATTSLTQASGTYNVEVKVSGVTITKTLTYAISFKGANGEPTYTWVKYADTATGEGMSDSSDGKRFLGLAHNKTTTTESNTASDYSWSPLYDNVEVGGRNLFTNSGNFQNTTNWSGVTIAYEGGVPYFTGTGTPTNSADIPLEPGAEYVFTAKLRFNIAFPIGSSTPNHIYVRYPGESTFSALDGVVSLISNETQTIAGQWHVISLRFKTKPDTSKIPGLKFHAYTGATPSVKDILWVKLEKGNIATDWTPAPEDVDKKITTLNAAVDVLEGEISSKATKTEIDNATNDLIAFSIVEYYLSTSSTSPVGGSWSDTAPAWINGRFMWSRTKTTTKAGAVTYHPNANGTNITGASGATGRGIASTEIHYQVSSSGTVTPTSWQTTIPTVAPEQYLWTRTTINYTSGSPSVSYSIGQAGKGGASGADGRSVTSSTVDYQKSTSGTTVPTGTWLTSIPTVAASEYLWTRTTFNYSSGTTPIHSYSVGKMGNTGRGITSITPNYYLSTSNTSQVGGSWSTTPPPFNKDKYLWTRSSIVWNNPTETTTTTPVLSTEWNTLADHETRVYNAEQKILPNSIKGTVEAIKNSEGKPYFAQTSVVEQTVDTWTAKFSSIGGVNLLRATETTISNSSYPTATYEMAENMVAGQKYTITIWGQLGAGKSSFTAYLNGGSIQLAAIPLKSTGVYRATFTGVANTTQNPNRIHIYPIPNTIVATSRINKIQLEKGEVGTEWTPHPDELYTGVTKIDQTGVEVSQSNSSIKTKMSSSGTLVTDNGETVANFGEITTIPYANITQIESEDVVGTVVNLDDANGNYNYEIGATGKDFTTVSGALEAIFGNKGARRFLINDTNINLWINGTIQDKVVLKGIAGNGRIYIYFRSGAKLYGSIWARDCTNRIYIRSEINTKAGRGMIVADDATKDYAVFNEASKHVHLINMDIKANTKTAGVQGNDAGTTILDGCDLVGLNYGTWCRYSHTIRVLNCKGNATTGHYADQLGIQLIGGTCVKGSSSNVNHSTTYGGYSLVSGTVTGTVSAFDPPTTTDKTFTQTFRAISLKTKTSTGTWQTYYGDTAAQNRWDTSSPLSVGQITFSSDVYSFMADRKTGTTPTIKIRMHRKNTSHGSSSAIKPDPANFSSTAFSSISGAVRGGWTGWATLTTSNISSSGNTLLTVGTGKTDVNYNPSRYYAIWDIVEIEVTKIKNV